ncbi:MAG: LysM peptidoglycan-binding domain-containing protein [Chloroflexi bacterium]|nr:LysM peptidoglycan-binding domain-containing protein [Chloroflexota bacterium]
MNKRIFGLLGILLIVVFLFTSCERPASVSPNQVPTEGNEIPFPVATQPQIMMDILRATQTAAALVPQIGGGEPLVTSTPAFTVNTPVAAQTAVPVATAAPTKTSYPAPTPGRPATYTIQAAEFVYCIARRFNVNPSDLLSLNGLNINSNPAIGAVLNIPTSGAFPGERARKTHPTSYTVLSGESMGKIACDFGDADPNTIYAANGLTVGSALSAGQVLQIP